MEPASLASRADSLLTVDDGNDATSMACGGDPNTSTSENQPPPGVMVVASFKPRRTRQPPKDSVKGGKWRRCCQNCKKHVPHESWLKDCTTHTGCVQSLVVDLTGEESENEETKESPQDEIDPSTTGEQKANTPAIIRRKTSSTKGPPKKLKRVGGPLHCSTRRVRAPTKRSGLYSLKQLKIPDYVETKRNQEGRVSMYICNHHDHKGKGREIPVIGVRLVNHLRSHKDELLPCDFCQIPGLSNETAIIRHQLNFHPVQLFKDFKVKDFTRQDFKTLIKDVMEDMCKSSFEINENKSNYKCKFCTGKGAGFPTTKYRFACHLLKYHKSVIGETLIELQGTFGFGSTMIT